MFLIVLVRFCGAAKLIAKMATISYSRIVKEFDDIDHEIKCVIEDLIIQDYSHATEDERISDLGVAGICMLPKVAERQAKLLTKQINTTGELRTRSFVKKTIPGEVIMVVEDYVREIDKRCIVDEAYLFGSVRMQEALLLTERVILMFA
jgi:hypothetical protein